MAKTLVILNPVSGNGAGVRLWSTIAARLLEGGLDFDLAHTTGPQSGIGIAEKAKRSGYETLVAIGGDGTANEVVNGMLRASAEGPTGTLGIIPVGSGNDFTKMFDAKPHWTSAVERILRGKPRWIDIGQVTGDSATTRYFLNALDTGFGAQVAQHVHEIPRLTGFLMYLAGILKGLIKYSVPRVKIDLEDDPIEQRSTMVVAANGRCMGSGFWIAPEAVFDDGLFDIIVADGLGRIGILSLLPKVMQGKHLGDPRVYFTRSSCLTIQSPDPLVVETDGEIPYVGAHHLEIKILPRHLQVLAIGPATRTPA